MVGKHYFGTSVRTGRGSTPSVKALIQDSEEELCEEWDEVVNLPNDIAAAVNSYQGASKSAGKFKTVPPPSPVKQEVSVIRGDGQVYFMSDGSIICYWCKQPGHPKRECPYKKAKAPKLNKYCTVCDDFGHHYDSPECPSQKKSEN